MAIIKNGRINLWNAVKKQFEVVHPETEVERITDFADGIVQKLALTSAMTAVTALQTDSWFGKLLKMALTASGVKYSIAENGYVCFGELFGGLIIQWGTTTVSGVASEGLPIAASNEIYLLLTTIKANRTLDGNVVAYATAKDLSSIQITLDWDTNNPGPMNVMLLAICR